MAAQSDSSAQSDSPYVPVNRKDIAQVALLGLASGALIVFLGELLQRFFINPVLCQNASGGDICGPTGLAGFYVSTVVVSVVSIIILARFGIFRPLLVAVGAAVALWGIKGDIQGVGLLEYAFWVAILYAMTYLLLYWLLRARNFVISLVLVIAAVIVLRLIFVL